MSMHDLAASYDTLGRYNEALAMRESVLEFRSRVLPEKNPDLGEGHLSLWKKGGDACSLLCTVDVDSFSFSHDLVQH
jgi:hypothetical protein